MRNQTSLDTSLLTTLFTNFPTCPTSALAEDIEAAEILRTMRADRPSAPVHFERDGQRDGQRVRR